MGIIPEIQTQHLLFWSQTKVTTFFMMFRSISFFFSFLAFFFFFNAPVFPTHVSQCLINGTNPLVSREKVL